MQVRAVTPIGDPRFDLPPLVQQTNTLIEWLATSSSRAITVNQRVRGLVASLLKTFLFLHRGVPTASPHKSIIVLPTLIRLLCSTKQQIELAHHAICGIKRLHLQNCAKQTSIIMRPYPFRTKQASITYRPPKQSPHPRVFWTAPLSSFDASSVDVDVANHAKQVMRSTAKDVVCLLVIVV